MESRLGRGVFRYRESHCQQLPIGRYRWVSAAPPMAVAHRFRLRPQIQTETYLETLSDRAPEEEAGVQTEAALNRPPAPLFVPAPVRCARAPLLRLAPALTQAPAPPPHLSPRAAVGRGRGDADRGGRLV